MKKTLLLLITVLLFSCGRDYSVYMRLKNPEISFKENQKMLVYKVKGSPENTGGKAFKALYSVFYGIKSKYDLENSAPRARWFGSINTPQSEWMAVYGIPVSSKVISIPKKYREKYPQVKLDVWKYGETAEILHVGAYDQEKSSVDKLHKHIHDSGYTITGPHEEEYLKGPGMFLKGNPDKYLTIIRYSVRKYKTE